MADEKSDKDAGKQASKKQSETCYSAVCDVGDQGASSATSSAFLEACCC